MGNQTRGSARWIMESNRKKTRWGVGIESKGWGQAYFRVKVMESPPEKGTLRQRSGIHEAAHQETRPELERDFCASRTQRR